MTAVECSDISDAVLGLWEVETELIWFYFYLYEFEANGGHLSVNPNCTLTWRCVTSFFVKAAWTRLPCGIILSAASSEHTNASVIQPGVGQAYYGVSELRCSGLSAVLEFWRENI